MKIKKPLFLILTALASVMLIILGLFRVIGVYQNYRTEMLSFQSAQLDRTVRSGASGLDLLLATYNEQVKQYLNRREFFLAEEYYEESGDPLVMQSLMLRPDITRPDMPCSVAVYDTDGAFIASSSTVYPTDTGKDEDIGGGYMVRTDEQAQRWFVFASTSAEGYRYEVAVPLQTMLQAFGNNNQIGQHGYLYVIDSSGSFIWYYRDGQGASCSLSSLLGANPSLDKSEIMRMVTSAGDPPEPYYVTKVIWPEGNGTAEDTLSLAAPVQSTGGGLVLCASLRFAEFNAFLPDMLGQISHIILLEIVGTLLLFGLVAWVIILNRRNQLELEAVRERADLMEEINRQQQSLAHTERLQQLGVMTGGIVHECNNLLTPIMGQSLLLLEELEEDSPQFEKTLDIYEASEHARDVLQRMSALGKKNVDMAFRPIEVGTLLRKTMNLAAMAKDPHILQELTLPDDPVYFAGNEQLFTQAILNLCINACQAMGTEGTLSVSAEADTRSGREYVEIVVRDTGPGIPEETMDSIFVPFFTTKGNQGTGVGLAICQKIIETHKGTVQAANRPEGGAELTVRVPTCDPPAEE